jgi:hypothetical protein
MVLQFVIVEFSCQGSDVDSERDGRSNGAVEAVQESW